LAKRSARENKLGMAAEMKVIGMGGKRPHRGVLGLSHALFSQRVKGFSIKRKKTQAMAMVVTKRINEPVKLEKLKDVRVRSTNLINNERTEA